MTSVNLERGKLAFSAACLAAVSAAIGWWSAMQVESRRRRKRAVCTALQPRTQERTESDSGDHKGKPLNSPAARLRELLSSGKLLTMPCAYDALTAKLIERMGFEITFMTGFGVSAVRGYPDCQLVSYQEMLESAFGIGSALRGICCIADGDTGYGNAMNVKRTVRGYAQAGMAGIMIEDQVAPKRCGHTKGKAVISHAEAVARVRAACDARDEGPWDICIMARTDARATHGLDEAIARCKAFREAGADITFLEAPLDEHEMERYCNEVSGPKLANMLRGGKTPMLSLKRLEEIGFALAAYPVALLASSVSVQIELLQLLKEDKDTSHLEVSFEQLKELVGFGEYYQEEERYST